MTRVVSITPMHTIFISGGARGIGAAVAKRFAQEGWTVGIYDVTPESPEVAALQAQHGARVIAGVLDVTSAEGWQRALADFTGKTGKPIDVLHNNAGVLVAGDLAQLSPDEVALQINVNCLGLTLGARAASEHLSAGGTLVNMGSASAIYGQPGIATYSASKFYVQGLTEALDLEWRRRGIRVVSINPLWAKTALAQVDVGSTRRLGVRITPEQVAEAVWGAVHPANRWQRTQIHYGVSLTDRLLATAGRFAPQRLARLINRLIAG